jgi:hypothetical protein
MVTSLDLLASTFIGALALVGFLLLLLPLPQGAGLRTSLERVARRVPRDRKKWGPDWWWPALGAAVIYSGVTAYNLAYGLYGCSGTPGVHDLVAYVASGRALLTGGDPFVVTACGATIAVPYGFAALLLNALGSLGGMAGVVAVWGLVTVVVLPLTWWAAGPDRRYVTAVVASSVLFLPLAVTQIDGASNLMVPVAILITLLLARRHGTVAAALGGFLATGRFPTVGPVLGATGRFHRPWLSGAIAVTAFGAASGATYVAYGHGYLVTVFVNEVNRRSFSLNFYGILEQQGWLPTSDWVLGAQVALAVLLVAVVWWRARSALCAATITLAGVALLNPFLSFNILGWLLPVAIVGSRPRWELWGIGLVGTANYYVGYQYWGIGQGLWGPYELLDVALTILLLVLFIDLWRADQTVAATDAGSPAGPTSA